MPAPRRTPVQARSRARVDAILDAADAVFLEMGFAAATTNHVAARAGTSIGSLYRFFPDKEALLVALAERYGGQMQAIAREVSHPDRAALTIRGMVERGVRTFNGFMVDNPGFATIVEQQGHPALRAGAAAHGAEMLAIMLASQARVAPHLAPEALAVVTEVSYTALSALQLLSVSRDAEFRERVVEETIALVSAYLAARLGIDADAPIFSG